VSDERPFNLPDEPENRAGRRARDAQADEALVSALGQAARAVAASEPAGPSPAAWHRLTRGRAPSISRGPRPLVWGAMGAVACASLVATLAVVRHFHPPSLTYDVSAGALGSSGQVEAGPLGSALRFSDGTEIALDAKARLAVGAAGPHGARLRLQAGAAHFRVMHLPRAAWAVEAGPYVVEVTGTEFDVRWSEREQTVEVKMISGSVRVSGPLLTERVALGKGQHLLARPGMGDLRIDDGRPVHPAETAPASAPIPASPAPRVEPLAPAAGTSASPQPALARAEGAAHRLASVRPHARRRVALAEPAASGADRRLDPGAVEDRRPAVDRPPVLSPPPLPDRPPSSAAPKWRARNWSSRVAAGDAGAVVADAESVGLDTTMHQADAGDLAALADAARYAGRPELAEQAFSATRHRFPGSSRAHAAAFLLGRMADDRGDAAEGLRWYRAYLEEAPAGPYAAEALGRQMLVVKRSQGREAALPIAREYLGRFPNGTYLLEARALIDNR
jgi:ferric-dicitrate binding protein FerR (iron transport regulator)